MEEVEEYHEPMEVNSDSDSSNSEDEEEEQV